MFLRGKPQPRCHWRRKIEIWTDVVLKHDADESVSIKCGDGTIDTLIDSCHPKRFSGHH
jgi:hypothetical protein